MLYLLLLRCSFLTVLGSNVVRFTGFSLFWRILNGGQCSCIMSIALILNIALMLKYLEDFLNIFTHKNLWVSTNRRTLLRNFWIYPKNPMKGFWNTMPQVFILLKTIQVFVWQIACRSTLKGFYKSHRNVLYSENIFFFKRFSDNCVGNL